MENSISIINFFTPSLSKQKKGDKISFVLVKRGDKLCFVLVEREEVGEKWDWGERGKEKRGEKEEKEGKEEKEEKEEMLLYIIADKA